MITSGKGLEKRGFRRRAAWSTLDQAIFSATNVVLGIVVARSVSASHFGAFSAAYLTYVLLGLLSRAACSEVLVVRFSASSPAEQRRGIQASVGTALLTGVLAAVSCGGVAIITDGVVRSAFVALAVCMPALFVQDAWRFAFFVQARPAAAAANDLLWAAVQFMVLAAVAATGGISVVSAILAWGAGAYVCSVVGGIQAGTRPSPRLVRWWWDSQRDLAPRFVAESAIGRGSGQLTFFLVAIVTSLAAFGALRAGNLLLGPLNVLFASVAIVAIPEGVRLHQISSARVWRLSASVAGAMVVTAAAVGAVLLALPSSAGEAILGDSWPGARHVLLPLTCATAALAMQMAAMIGLRSMALAQDSLKARAATAPLRLVFGTVGALVGGAVGAAWGLALGESLGALIYWRQLAAAYRRTKFPSTTAHLAPNGEARETTSSAEVDEPLLENRW